MHTSAARAKGRALSASLDFAVRLSSHLRAVWAAVWLSPQHDPADPYAVAAVIDVSLAVTAFWPAIMLVGDIGPPIGLRTPHADHTNTDWSRIGPKGALSLFEAPRFRT